MSTVPLMDEVHDRPRSSVALVFDPVFGGVFWGKLISTVGAWMHSIVAAIVVFEATGSALLVGLISVAEFVPQLLFSPLSGTWADRGHSVTLIIVGQVVCFTGSGALAFWIWFAPEEYEAFTTAAVLLSTALVGFGMFLAGPAMQSIVPSLIRPGELAMAMTLNTAPITIGRIAGPAVGAFVTVEFGAATAFAISAVTDLAFIALVVAARVPSPASQGRGADYSVRGALRYVRRDRPLLLALVVIAAIGFGSEPLTTMAPALAQSLGGGTALVGSLATVSGVGAGFGLMVMGLGNHLMSSTLWATIGLWLMVFGYIATAAAPNQEGALLAFGAMGVGFSWALTGASTLVQRRAPVRLRGRIMALWTVGFIGLRPVAAALTGAVVDVVSVPAALLVTAVILATVAFICHPKALNEHEPGESESDAGPPVTVEQPVRRTVGEV